MLENKPLSALVFALVSLPTLAWADRGASMTFGGGGMGFTDQTMRDVVRSNVGKEANVHVTFGTRTLFGLELGYVGSLQSIDALSGSKSGTLLGTTLEGVLRWNILPHDAWDPYVFAGIGWQRYDITGARFSMSDSGINDSDNSLVYPFGIGAAYRAPSGIVFDFRTTFRPSSHAGLVIDSTGDDAYAPLHAWEVSLGLGYEL